MTMTRTKIASTRRQLIDQIRSVNKPKGDDPRLNVIPIIILLRNIHPIYRKEEAKRLYDLGKITDKEYKSIKYPQYGLN